MIVKMDIVDPQRLAEALESIHRPMEESERLDAFLKEGIAKLCQLLVGDVEAEKSGRPQDSPIGQGSDILTEVEGN